MTFALNDVRIQSPQELFIDGYSTIIANNPTNGRRAGGSAVLINKEWTVKEIEHQEEEALILEITPTNSTTFILSTIYNRPGNLVPNNSLKAVERASSGKASILVVDFNSPCREFGSRTDTREGRHLLDLISNSTFLYVDNSDPTYYSDSKGNWNLLDLGFINQKMADKLLDFKVGPETGSDHMPMIFKISSERVPSTRSHVRVDWDQVESIAANSTMLEETARKIDEEWSRLRDGGAISTSTIDTLVETLTDGMKEVKREATRKFESKPRTKLKFLFTCLSGH